MSATLVVRHNVSDFTAWKVVYDELESFRAKHGCIAQRVWSAPNDPNDVLVLHDFGSVDQATAFAGSDELRSGMARAGVAGPPRVEIFSSL